MTVRCKFTIIYSPLNLSSYFSFYVTASSLAILLSLRGAKRRSNPEKERACTGLLRYARNDELEQDLVKSQGYLEGKTWLDFTNEFITLIDGAKKQKDSKFYTSKNLVNEPIIFLFVVFKDFKQFYFGMTDCVCIKNFIFCRKS